MRAIIPEGQTVEDVAKQLLRCLVNLRFWERKVNEEGGRECRVALKNWQEKTDILLQSLDAKRGEIKNEQIIIKTSNNENY